MKPNNKLGKARFVIVLMALAVLCVSAVAQENTTDYWVAKANNLRLNGSTDDAISAYDRALRIDPENDTV